MIAKSAHTTLRAFPTMFPVRISRLSERYPRASEFSDRTKSEMIDIAERSGEQVHVCTQLVSVFWVAAALTMLIATSAACGLQIAELANTQIQLTTGDLMRVIAGR